MTLTLSGAPLLTYLLASVRLVAWLLVAPPFASRAVPVLVKTLLALSLSLVVVPTMRPVAIPADVPTLALTVLQEALIGASLGFVAYVLLAAVEAAGNLVDVFGGFSVAAAYDPLELNMNSVHGKLFSMLATMLLFASGLHLLVIRGLLATFEQMPVGSAWQPASAGEVVSTAVGVFFAAAVQIALPLMALLFLADLGLALLTRVAPQLNAIGIMFPAKIGLTLLVVGMSFAVIPDALEHVLEMLSQAMASLAVAR